MKRTKLNLKCITLLIVACATNLAISQQSSKLIIGEPDVYQDYLLLNTDPGVEGDIASWKIAIFEQYYDTINETVKERHLESIGTRELKSFLRIDPRYREKLDFLKIKVVGLDKDRNVVADDVWLQNSVPPWHINNEPFCSETCVGKTYAFDVVINERVDLNGNNVGGHTVTFRDHNTSQNQGGYIPEYRHMTFNQASTLHSNSSTQCADDLTETYCHYGINDFNVSDGTSFFGQGGDGIDGVKLKMRENITQADQLKDRDGNVLTGTVYSIQKRLGKWQNQVDLSDELANDPATPCGQFGTSITSMINYANNNLDLIDDLSCNGFGGGSNPFGGYTRNVWSDLHDGWIDSDEDIWDILDEVGETINETGFDDNNTGVDWWPSDDVSQVQLINIKKGVNQSKTQSTKTLYRDSLFNQNGEPNYNNISMKRGLYNVSLTLEGGYTFPLLLEKTTTETTGFDNTNFLNVNIYPNPIVSGDLTISLEADATLKFDYKILDGQGAELYSRDNITLSKDTSMDLYVPVDDFPSGSLIHVFEMSDGSSVSYNSIKN